MYHRLTAQSVTINERCLEWAFRGGQRTDYGLRQSKRNKLTALSLPEYGQGSLLIG